MTHMQWVPEALSLGVKREGHEANHLPPSSAEFHNAWRCTLTPSYVFVVLCLVKQRKRLHGVVLS